MDTWSEAGDEKETNIVGTKRNTAHRSLMQKLEAILASYELQEKYSTKLSAHSLNVIEKIIKTKPEFVRIVESTFIRNVNNNEIEANDIPYIISIISHLYSLLGSMNLDSRTESIPDTCNYILKFLISVIIREQLVKIDDETSAVLLILCCENIIDACVKLLKMKSDSDIKPIKTRDDHLIEPAFDISSIKIDKNNNIKQTDKTTVIENQSDRCC
uniref:Uncharacterized protein n=1 Tax=viral metagenome TaxID=1070528 RepID=A0A6C0DQA6_9ZZZZ